MVLQPTKVKALQRKLDCGWSLARELLILAGGDADLVIECSNSASGLSECKALIINARLSDCETFIEQEEGMQDEETTSRIEASE